MQLFTNHKAEHFFLNISCDSIFYNYENKSISASTDRNWKYLRDWESGTSIDISDFWALPWMNCHQPLNVNTNQEHQEEQIS